MARIKSFTSLEQSKKLAEILPLESTDMHYISFRHKDDTIEWVPQLGTTSKYDIPCWSLAALLGVLPRYIIDLGTYVTFLLIYPTQNLGWVVEYSNNNHGIDFSFDNKNLIDACVAMIEKLHELKML